MNLFDTTQLGLERAIAGAGLRQATIANNIANANTPGFQRKDVDFHTTLRAAMESESPADVLESASFAAEADGSGAMRYDGNGVDIDRESATLAANALEYEALMAVAGGRNDVLRSAMGVG